MKKAIVKKKKSKIVTPPPRPVKMGGGMFVGRHTTG